MTKTDVDPKSAQIDMLEKILPKPLIGLFALIGLEVIYQQISLDRIRNKTTPGHAYDLQLRISRIFDNIL